MAHGAQPSERVALFLAQAGIIPAPEMSARPKKSAPKKKAQERLARNSAEATPA
jgi:small subunit ribosomal protein S16